MPKRCHKDIIKRSSRQCCLDVLFRLLYDSLNIFIIFLDTLMRMTVELLKTSFNSFLTDNF